MAADSPVPLDSPLRTVSKPGISTDLKFTSLHGHISGNPRTATAESALQARRKALISSSSLEEINEKLKQTSVAINEIMERNKRKNEEVDREIERHRAQRNTEKKVLQKMQAMKKLEAEDDEDVDMMDI